MVAHEIARPEGELRVLAREGVTGAFGLMASNVLATGLAAFASITIARALGPGGYGLYVLALTGVGLLQIFAGLGLPSAVTFFSARSRSIWEASYVLRLGLLLSAASCIPLVVLGFILLPVINSSFLRAETINEISAIALPTVLVIPLFNALSSFFIGVGKASIAGLINVLRELFRLAALATLIAFVGLTTSSAVAMYTASYVFALTFALLLAVHLLRKGGRTEPCSAEPRKLVRPSAMLTYGLPFYITGALVGLVNVSENVLLARTSSVEDLAGFRASMNVVTAIGLIAGPIFTVALPIFAKVPEGARPSRIYGVSHALAFSLVAPLATMAMVLSKEVLILLYGRSFERFYDFLLLLSFTHLALALGGGFASSVLAGFGRPWLSNFASLVELLFLLSLSLLAGRAYGAIGVVIAIVIARWMSAVYSYLVLRKSFGLSFDQGKILRIVLASLVASVLSLSLKLALEVFVSSLLLLTAIVGLAHVASYFLVLALLRPFTVQELSYVMLAMEPLGPFYKAFRILLWWYESVNKMLKDIRARWRALSSG